MIVFNKILVFKSYKMNKIPLLLLKVVLTLVRSTFFLMSCKKDKIEFTVDCAYWDSIDKVKL